LTATKAIRYIDPMSKQPINLLLTDRALLALLLLRA
jgi:hypothetical protein